MLAIHCDLLIVGGGPAGSSAAKAAAQEGIDTLVVEQREIIGVPVQCAEYVPLQLVGALDLGRDFVVQHVKGMQTYINGRLDMLTNTPGCMVRRDLFDQALAKSAQDAGAKYMLGTRVLSRDKKGFVHARQKNGEELRIKPRIIIGADGPHSRVGKWVGAPNHNLLPGAQATLKLAAPLKYTEVYFEPEIFAGYGWVFPKKDVANVGLGLKRAIKNKSDNPAELLRNFIAKLKQRGKIVGDVIDTAAGWIPAESVRNAVYGDTILAGDAAGHTHPITGAGIFNAVTCGEMAGEHAAEALNQRDLCLLEDYEDDWREFFADTLARAYSRRVYMEERWNDFQNTVQSCWVAYHDYYKAAC